MRPWKVGEELQTGVPSEKSSCSARAALLLLRRRRQAAGCKLVFALGGRHVRRVREGDSHAESGNFQTGRVERSAVRGRGQAVNALRSAVKVPPCACRRPTTRLHTVAARMGAQALQRKHKLEPAASCFLQSGNWHGAAARRSSWAALASPTRGRACSSSGGPHTFARQRAGREQGFSAPVQNSAWNASPSYS